jgi:hypothetical protein
MEGFTSLMEEFMTSSYMDPPSHGMYSTFFPSFLDYSKMIE